MTNDVAYYDSELVTAVKSFIVQAPEVVDFDGQNGVFSHKRLHVWLWSLLEP